VSKLNFLENTGLAVIASPFVVVIVALGNVIFFIPRAWAFCTLWSWFVTPKYGQPAPEMLTAYGLMLIWGVFTGTVKSTPKETKESTGQLFAQALLYPPLAVALGWIALKLF
jgi:hypothetical protein